KHRRRTSRTQLKVLERSFSENSKPNASVRRTLAQTLDMTPRGVQIWFQNRRAKAK
ncbi:homeobox domain-containing protein, partial [Blakeslea trispora]